MTHSSKTGALISFTLPFWVIIGYYLVGLWDFITLAHVFIILPIIDAIIGVDNNNL